MTHKAILADRQKTDGFVQFSTVTGKRGASDTVCEIRGFAIKFYSEEGNWDLLVDNNTSVFLQEYHWWRTVDVRKTVTWIRLQIALLWVAVG